LAGKKQTSFFTETFSLADVYREFEQIAREEGKRSQRGKMLSVRKLLANAEPREGRYLARLMMGELRIGIGEGNVRDAIAKAFGIPAGDVEHAFQANNDLGETAVLARKGREALRSVQIAIFRPVRLMLAQQGTIGEMVADHGEVAAEFKYDGSRFQFHRKGDTVKVYSRKLEDVTNALPDVIQALLPSTSHDVILDGEAVAEKDGRPMPFQFVLRRFRRKYDVESKAEEIRLVPYVFDILFRDGKTLIDLPYTERRKILEESLSAHVAPRVVSGEVADLEAFYQQALDAGHEGIMVKAPASPYSPGVRGRMWAKIKPGVDTLDLAVIGAEWGEGRRAHLFGSFLLACSDSGELLAVGKVATGLSDEMLSGLYEIFREKVILQEGKEVRFEPEEVFEVGYSEIQASPNYPGGFALRFPRFIQLRDDKGIGEIDTLDTIRSRYQRQSKSG
ncbi:MAG: ATP-dependent DNA ligase, partial [Methanomicrobiales archaeon]|nr:ATP-dependent DNA ligase [Methanomicrobiales archaeon]